MVLGLVSEDSQRLRLITHMLYRNTRQYKPYSTWEAIMLSSSYSVLTRECFCSLLPAWIRIAWTWVHELFPACFRLIFYVSTRFSRPLLLLPSLRICHNTRSLLL